MITNQPLKNESSESKILWTSPTENTLLYDFGSNTTYEMPRLRYKGCHPITISIPRPDAPQEEDLYVMSSIRYSNGLEVLRFGSHSNSEVKLYPKPPETWQWYSLPPPPLPEGAFICSHALLHDGRTICVTAAPRGTAGTYYFDTVEREWSRAPDDWDLPFFGGAEYIPDLRLWLGVAIDGNRLCASDLSVSVDEERPPTLKHQWEGVQTPEEWQTVKVRLINLGKGRFCIFKVIHDLFDKDGFEDYYSYRGNLKKILALLSGVEINYSPEQGLKMVTHKTLSYIFSKDKIILILVVGL